MLFLNYAVTITNHAAILSHHMLQDLAKNTLRFYKEQLFLSIIVSTYFRLEGYIIKESNSSGFFSSFQSITALIPGFFDDLVFSSDDSSIDEDDDTARSR